MIPNRLIVFLISCCFYCPIFSQTYFGFKGGINRSNAIFIFNIDPVLITDTGGLDGFYFSVPFEIEGNDFFNFLPAIIFASDGTVISVQSKEGERTYNNAIFYAKIPVLAKLKLFKNKNYQFGVTAGFIPAYAIDVKSYYFSFPDVRKNIDRPVDFISAGINRFDLALSLGISTEKIIAKGWKIILDARYNLGLIDVENHSLLTTTTEGFSLTLGLMTPLFKDENPLMF